MTSAIIFASARHITARARRLGATISVLAVLGANTVAAPAKAEISLVFGIYTSDKPSAVVSQVRPTLLAIAAKTSEVFGETVSFRMQVVKNYTEGVDHIVAGKFDIMRLGPASYVLAKERADGITILAQENNSGKNTFNGVIAVHRDSPLKSIDELRGKRFAFGSNQSTLGRFFAQLHLTEHHILAKDLGHFEYLGRHDKVGAAVGAGLFDAGALEETTFHKLVKKGTPIRALFTFPNATRPWIARVGLDSRIRAALTKAMLSITNRAAFAALRFDGFLPGDDRNYQGTRRAIRENGRFFAGYEAAPPMQQSSR